MVFFTYDDYCRNKRDFFTAISLISEDSATYSYNSVKDVHDKLYRDFLSNKLEFSLFLKEFLGFNIPAEQLIEVNNAFVTNDYKNRRSDIIYKIKDKPVYLFLEHQSSIDNGINFRIMEYYYCLLKSVTDLKKLKAKDYKFPIIIPILLYSGSNKWNLVPNIKEKQVQIDCSDFSYSLLDFTYKYVNISDYIISKLLKMDSIIAYILATDKCKNKYELYDILNKLSIIVTDSERRKSFQRLITYIFKNFFDEDEYEELLNKFEEGVDVNMKYAWDYVKEDIAREKQEAINDGLKKGLTQGIAQGISQGILQGTSDMIKKMLKNGESMDKIKLYSGFSTKEIEKIKKELNLAI